MRRPRRGLEEETLLEKATALEDVFALALATITGVDAADVALTFADSAFVDGAVDVSYTITDTTGALGVQATLDATTMDDIIVATDDAAESLDMTDLLFDFVLEQQEAAEESGLSCASDADCDDGTTCQGLAPSLLDRKRARTRALRFGHFTTDYVGICA